MRLQNMQDCCASLRRLLLSFPESGLHQQPCVVESCLSHRRPFAPDQCCSTRPSPRPQDRQFLARLAARPTTVEMHYPLSTRICATSTTRPTRPVPLL